MLQGYVTYLSAAGVVGATVLHALGYLPDHAYDTLLGLLGGTGLAGLRRSNAATAGELEKVKAAVGVPPTGGPAPSPPPAAL